MKIFYKFLAVTALIALLTQNVFGSSMDGSPAIVTGSSIDVTLQGRMVANIISVIMPTRVDFAVTPEIAEWNKVISPDFNIQNVGNVSLKVAIAKAVLNTSNIKFSTATPIFANDIRQIRIGMAPKNNYSTIQDIGKYLFNDNVNNSNPIILKESLDSSPTNNTAMFSIYGDISSGWKSGDEFSISTVFRVSLN